MDTSEDLGSQGSLEEVERYRDNGRYGDINPVCLCIKNRVCISELGHSSVTEMKVRFDRTPIPGQETRKIGSLLVTLFWSYFLITYFPSRWCVLLEILDLLIKSGEIDVLRLLLIQVRIKTRQSR